MNLGMFGRARFRQNAPAFDKIFDNEGLTLEAVMDYGDDAAAELKLSNKRFLDFLDSTKLEVLINYLIVEPPEHLEPKLRFKYPFVACEFLSCSSPEINNRIIKENLLLEKLYSYLNSQECLNITSLGYLSKVMQSLLSTSAYEVLRFLHDENRVDLIIRHFYSKSLADLIGRLLLCEEYGNPEFQDSLFDLIEKVVFCISSENSVEAVYNASNLLIEIVSKKAQIKNWGYIFGYLLGDLCIEHIFKQVFEGNSIVKKEASRLLCCLFNNTDMPDPDNSDDDNKIIDEEDQKIIFEMIKYMDQVEKILQNNEGSIRTSFNEEIPILGEGKIRMIEILASAIKISSLRFNNLLADSQILKISTDLMFQNYWNSFLHQAYYKLISSIFESKSDTLKLSLLSKAELPQRLYDLSQSQIIPSLKIDIRKGHLGFATKIGNLIIENSSYPVIDNLLAQSEEWKLFVGSFLIPQNRLDCIELGGRPAGARSRLGSEQDYDLPEGTIQQEEQEKKEEEANEVHQEVNGNEVENKEDEKIGEDEYSEYNYWKPQIKIDELEEL